MAAVAVVVSASSVSASAAMPAPEKSPVEQFIGSFNKFFVFDYVIADLDENENADQIEVLKTFETKAVVDIVSLFQEYGDYQLSASEIVQLANFLDVLADMAENEVDANDIASIKSKVFSFETLGDVYNALLDQTNEPEPDMETVTYADVTISYPKHYTLSNWDTDYGMHFYFQHDSETATSVYMEVEYLNMDVFGSYSNSDYEDFLISECRNYYDKYIDSDYKIRRESEVVFYEDSIMAVQTMEGIQYGCEFEGEIVSIVIGNCQITAFITGAGSDSEKEAREIFLSAIGSL